MIFTAIICREFNINFDINFCKFDVKLAKQNLTDKIKNLLVSRLFGGNNRTRLTASGELAHISEACSVTTGHKQQQSCCSIARQCEVRAVQIQQHRKSTHTACFTMVVETTRLELVTPCL